VLHEDFARRFQWKCKGRRVFKQTIGIEKLHEIYNDDVVREVNVAI
jgi:hypothetical protein